MATPPAIVAKLEKALSEAIHDPGASAKLKNMAVDPGGGPAAEFRQMIDTDIKKYAAVVQAANLHFEEE
jgi:tripartite-type tricarboxylate transporter receptor subunit TctC